MTALKTRLGRANWKGVWGWALDQDSPETKITVEIVINDQVVGRVVAGDPRPGLRTLPPEQRNCGFQFLFPNGLSALSRHVVHARSAADGAEFEHSPMIVDASPGFDAALEQTVGNALEVAVGAAQTQVGLNAPLEFVVEQITRLTAARRALPGGEAEALPPELAGLDERLGGLLRDRAGLAEAFPEPAGVDAAQRRVLVIGDAAPMIGDSSGMLLAHMRSLLRLGAALEFVASDREASANPRIAVLEAMGAIYHRPALSSTVEEALRRNRGLYDAIVLWRLDNFEKYGALARHYCPMARVIYGAESLLFVRMLRRAGLQNWPAGVERGEALRLREMMAAWASHATIVSSHVEADLLRRGVPQGNVHVVQWPAEPRPRAAGFEDRSGIGCVGDYQVHADLDAAAWLIEALMPAVWAIDPTIVCVVAGVNMPASLRTLTRDRIEVVDQAAGREDNLEVVFDRVRVTVATQRAGSGAPAGAVASWAAGVPCAGTSVALEGFALPEALGGCVVDDVEALAALLCRLHSDAAANAEYAEAGLRFVAESFSEAAIDRQMLAVIGVETAAAAEPGLETAAAAQ